MKNSPNVIFKKYHNQTSLKLNIIPFILQFVFNSLYETEEMALFKN